MAIDVFNGVPRADRNLRAKGAQIIPSDYRKILEEIERTLAEGKGWLGWKFIHEGRFYDLLNRLQAALPEDIRRATQVKQQAEMELANARQQASRILEEARAQGERIVDDAQRKAKALIAEHELTRRAEEQAQQITREASDRAAQTQQEAERYADAARLEADQYALEVRTTVDEYARQILERLDQVIGRAKKSVEEGLAAMAEPEDPDSSL